MKIFCVLSLFQLILTFCSADLGKDLHNGAYDLLKGAIEGATEVVGTPVDIKEVLFYLHTSKDDMYGNHTIDPLKPDEIAATNGKIFFLIHGWTQSREKTPWFKPFTEILFKKYPGCHVVQIDWSKAAANNYPFAAFSTESVGKIVGDVIYRIVKQNHVPRENIVVIGHSLGGQVSGWTGKRFKELTNTTLPRIIALDPAGPLFSFRPNEKRLNKEDADVVMVVHSDGGKLGFGDSCGTIDFFPNGGSDQPGCSQVDVAKVSSLTDPIWCDHQRGYNLFVEAVRAPECFLAKKCAKYDDFKNNKCSGERVSLGDLETTKTGQFYLDTSDKEPFIKDENTVGNGTKSRETKPFQEDFMNNRRGQSEKSQQIVAPSEVHDNKGNKYEQESNSRHQESGNKNNREHSRVEDTPKEIFPGNRGNSRGSDQQGGTDRDRNSSNSKDGDTRNREKINDQREHPNRANQHSGLAKPGNVQNDDHNQRNNSNDDAKSSKGIFKSVKNFFS